MMAGRGWALLLILGGLQVALSFDVSFDGHSVLSCPMHDGGSAVEMVNAARDQNLDVWSGHLLKGGDFHVQVPSKQRAWWTKKFGCGTYMDDVQGVIDQQFGHATLVGEGQGIGSEWFSKYHKFDTIVGRLKELAEAHPKITKFVPSIGKSHQGRHIPVIHLNASPKANKPQIWLNGGQHAREWIAPAVVMYMTQQLLTDYKKNPKVKKLMDKFEFVVAPVINPDGYEYTFTGNRLWRKNRRDNGDGSMGVDMNRNWANHWGEGGASKNPSAIDYQGPAVASEPEVKACQNYIKSLKHRIAGIDFHSYGQMILRSKGWTKAKSHDENLLHKMATDMKSAIKKVHGTTYKSEAAAGLYPTTGSTDDWMSEQGKMWGHGWTVELGGKQGGKHGFLLPASHILPSGKEMYQGLLSFAENLSAEHDKRKKLGAKQWRSQWMRESRANKKLGEGGRVKGVRRRRDLNAFPTDMTQHLADLSSDLAMLE